MSFEQHIRQRNLLQQKAINKSFVENDIEKAKELPIGSISMHGGKKMKKTGKDKWEPVTGDKKPKKEDEKKEPKSKKQDKPEHHSSAEEIIAGKGSKSEKARQLADLGMKTSSIAKHLDMHYSHAHTVVKKHKAKSESEKTKTPDEKVESKKTETPKKEKIDRKSELEEAKHSPKAMKSMKKLGGYDVIGMTDEQVSYLLDVLKNSKMDGTHISEYKDLMEQASSAKSKTARKRLTKQADKIIDLLTLQGREGVSAVKVPHAKMTIWNMLQSFAEKSNHIGSGAVYG